MINFYFKNSLYSINLVLFNNFSTYFLNVQPDNQEIIFHYLSTEFEEINKHTKQSINTFIQYFSNQNININVNNVMTIYYLSKKYKVNALKEIAKNYIKDHYQYFIDEFLSLGNNFFENANKRYEKILEDHFQEYINDDRLLQLPISTLYRVIKLHFKKNKTNEANYATMQTSFDSDEKEMIDFLLRYVNNKGIESTILFSSVLFSNNGLLYLYKAINENRSVYYDSIHERILKNPTVFYEYMKNQEKEKMELRLRISNIENQLSNIVKSETKRKEILQKAFYDINSSSFYPNESISVFNQLKGESQAFLITGLYDHYQKEILKKMKKLLQYFSNEQEKANYKFIDKPYLIIQSNNDNLNFQNITDNQIISITTNTLEMLYETDSFNSDEFVNVFNELDKMILYLQYPSSKYNDLFEKITAVIDHYSLNLKLIICIFSINESDKAFQYNNKIKSIIIDNEIKIIPGNEIKGICEGNTSLCEIDFGINVTEIGERSFYLCDHLKDIVFPPSVMNISKRSFYGCKSLVEITIPFTVKFIDEESFMNCEQLQIIHIDPYQTQINSSAFNNCSLLKHLIFLTSVTSIKEFNFDEYFKLELITIPESVENIESYAFSHCACLKNITIPETIQNIGSYSFSGCSSLVSITLPSSIQEIRYHAFEGIRKLEIKGNFTTITNDLFNECTSLVELTLPPSISVIESGAFKKLTSLESIVLQSSLDEIGYQAFDGIQHVEIKRNINRLPDNLFTDCKFLKSVILPKSIKKIGDKVFAGCESLKKLVMDPYHVQFNHKAFETCESLKYLIIPQSTKRTKSKKQIFITSIITEKLFKNSEKAKTWISDNIDDFSEIQIEIKYPSSKFNQIYQDIIELKKEYRQKLSICILLIKSKIIDLKFNKNNYIKYLRFDSTVKEMHTPSYEGSFEECFSLTKIVIPSSLTEIGSYSFRGCSSLLEIIFSEPSSLNSIYDSVFDECTSLKEIIIPSSVQIIGSNIFRGCSSLIKVTIPSSVIKIGHCIFDGCSSLKTISIPASIRQIDDRILDEFSSQKEIVIPSSITTIGCYAFTRFLSLKKVVIPSSVCSIESDAFNGCSSLKLISFSTPSSLTSIGDFAFSGCLSIKKILIPSSVTSIGSSAFNGCSSLSQISIPKSVNSIGSFAFRGCTSLTSVSIPSTLTEIGNNAFPRKTKILKV